jgi:hypothetical protein
MGYAHRSRYHGTTGIPEVREQEFHASHRRFCNGTTTIDRFDDLYTAVVVS